MSEQTITYPDTGVADEGEFDAPMVVLGLECSRPLAGSGRYSVAEVDQLVIGRGTRRGIDRSFVDGRSQLRLDVPDGWMSSEHVRLSRAGSQWVIEDLGSKNGTILNGEPLTRAPLTDGDLFEAGNTLFLFRSAVKRGFRDQPDSELAVADLLTDPLATLSLGLARLLADLNRVAPSAVPVLIHGATGSGKEVTARAIHARSGRSGPFIAINCGALAPTLIESELFGHRKGAFSGAAADHPGLVRAADGGTLFLDEIAELPESSQVKLLRVLQEKEVVPVGETHPVEVDIRVVAATHQDLEERVSLGSFRQDLFGRLAGYKVALPALRERREDLGLLIGALLTRIAGEHAGAVRLQRSVGRLLFGYDWPLNIRELEQALTAAVALAEDGQIQVGHLPAAIRGEAPAPTADRKPGDDQLREQLIQLLGQHRGNVSAVARAMGKARVQIRRWCKRFAIDPVSFR